MSSYPCETIEWTFFWQEDADKDRKRVLLVGDSIVDTCKRDVYFNLLPSGYAISAYVTSKGLNSPYYFKELALAAEQQNSAFDAVYFQYGGHTGEMSQKEAAETYRNAVLRLKEMFPKAKLVLGTFTCVLPGDGSEGEFHAPVTVSTDAATYSEWVLALNETVRAVAGEQGLPLLDAYAEMLPFNSHKLSDGIHFDDEASKVLAGKIADKILSALA